MSEIVVPDGWEVKSLSSVSNIVMGQSPLSSTYNTARDGLPFFQGKTDFGNHYPTIRTWCSEPTKIAPSKSILFSVRAPVGDVNISITECCIGRGLASISGTTSNQNYLYQQIQFIKPKFQLIAQGSTFEAVNGSDIKTFPVLIPPLPEQQKIASILTSVDEVIEKTQSQINKLQDMKKGTMNELLTKGIGHTEFKDSPVGKIPKGWEVKQLSEIGKLERGKFSHRPRNDPEFYDGDIPFLQTGDIPKGNPYITNYNQTLNEKGLGVSKLFNKGTLVITIAANIGDIGILSFNSCFPDSLVGITVNEQKSYSLFVLYVMRFLQDELDKVAPKNAQKNINLDILNPFVIPVPSVHEQQKIASILSSMDSHIEEKQRKLEQTQFLKKSLMQDLLTGKVRVTVN
jgi:type I restriction enzyme, S subunit